MSLAAKGAYIDILCHLADKHTISKEHIFIICQSSDSLMSEIMPKLIIDSNGEYYSERLRIEVEKRKSYAKSRRENRLKAMDKPKKEKKKTSKTYVRHMEDVNENEIEIYFTENGYSIEAAKKFFKYYSEADWKDSKGNKVKNWKQKAQAVWFKEENKIQQRKGTWVDEFGKVHSDQKLTL